MALRLDPKGLPCRASQRCARRPAHADDPENPFRVGQNEWMGPLGPGHASPGQKRTQALRTDSTKRYEQLIGTSVPQLERPFHLAGGEELLVRSLAGQPLPGFPRTHPTALSLPAPPAMLSGRGQSNRLER